MAGLRTPVVSPVARRGMRAYIPLLALAAWWALYGLMLAIQLAGMRSADGQAFTWTRALLHAFGSTWVWVPMTLAAYAVIRRYPVRCVRFWQSAGISATTVAGFIVLKALYVVATNPAFGWYPHSPAFAEVLHASLRNNLMLGIMVVAMLHGVVYFERLEDKERRLAALERNLAQARLEAVKAQLNPHFLFNALNSLAELMQDDVEQADRMLLAICAILRDGLRTDQGQERPLREELRHVADYLMIEEIRLGARMTSSIRIDDACMDIPVPVFSLQPLVENAIVHAIARSRAPGWIRMTGWLDEADLHVTIENSRAAEGARSDGNGLGQRAVEERLQLLHGPRGRLHRIDTDPDFYGIHLVVPRPGSGVAQLRGSAGAPA